jgi:hypothetical protein
MTPAEMRVWVAQSRARQGLGPTITDDAVQEQLSEMIAEVLVRQKGRAEDAGAEHRGGGPAESRRRHREAKPRTSIPAGRHGQA